MAVLECLPECISSLQCSVRDIDFEGFGVRVNSFRNEIVVKSCLRGIVRMDIYLTQASSAANLNDACP